MSQLEGTNTFGQFYRAAYDAASCEPVRSRFQDSSRAGNEREMVEAIIRLDCVASYQVVASYRGKDDELATKLYESSLKLESDPTGKNCEEQIETLRLLEEALFASNAGSRVFLDALSKRANYWHRIGAFARCLRDCESLLAIPDGYRESWRENANQFEECKERTLILKKDCLEKLCSTSGDQRKLKRPQTGKKNNTSGASGKISDKDSSNNLHAEILADHCAKNLPTLEGKPHPYLKSCSDAVALKFDEHKGRQLVATRNIHAGSVLIVDRPFSFSTDENALDRNCLHCHVTLRSENAVRIPCRQCQTVSFCSENCREEAWRNYHELECRVLNYFFEIESNRQHRQTSHLLLAYRTTVFNLLSIARNNNELAKSALEEILDLDLFRNVRTHKNREHERLNEEEKLAGHLAVDGNCESREFSGSEIRHKAVESEGKLCDLGTKTIYDPLDYRTVLQLVRHCKDAEPAINLLRAVEAVFFAKCLIFSLGVRSCDDALASLAADMLRHLLAINCNAYEITENVRDVETRVWEPRNVGGAIYTTVSLVNHGCYPNVVRHSYPRGVVVVRAIRFIKKGSELLDCYGPHFLSEGRLARREYLWQKYRFLCSCEACTNNWQGPFQELLGFKCPSCSEINLKQQPNNNVSKVITACCAKCKKKLDWKKCEKHLHKSVEKRKKAAMKMFNGNYAEALLLLLEHESFTEKYLAMPNMESIRTQQCIIQCFNSLGCTSK